MATGPAEILRTAARRRCDRRRLSSRCRHEAHVATNRRHEVHRTQIRAAQGRAGGHLRVQTGLHGVAVGADVRRLRTGVEARLHVGRERRGRRCRHRNHRGDGRDSAERGRRHEDARIRALLSPRGAGDQRNHDTHQPTIPGYHRILRETISPYPSHQTVGKRDKESGLINYPKTVLLSRAREQAFLKKIF